jgi:hypothetical protein
LSASIGGQEQPFGRPPLAPLRLCEFGSLKVVSQPQQAAAAPDHAHPAHHQPRRDPRQPGRESSVVLSRSRVRTFALVGGATTKDGEIEHMFVSYSATPPRR